MNMDQALQTFIVESRELLQDMEDSLLRIESETDQSESVNAIFRAAHTIKGSAGLFGLDDIVAFTHVLESVLDKVRSGKLAIDSDLVALFLLCGDHMAILVNHVESGSASPNQDDQLHRISADGKALSLSRSASHRSPRNCQPKQCSHASYMLKAQPAIWQITTTGIFRCVSAAMCCATAWIPCRSSAISAHWARSPASPRFRMPCRPLPRWMRNPVIWATRSTSRALPTKAAIEGVFEFVRDDCNIHILPPHSCVSDFVKMIKSLPEEDLRLGEILVLCGTLTRNELETILRSRHRQMPALTTHPVRIQNCSAPSRWNRAWFSLRWSKRRWKNKKISRIAKPRQQLLRVDAEKLDQLINLIGELVIAGAGVNTLARHIRQPALLEAASTLARLVEEVRDSALNLRMVQIGETFNRFQRVVRDVSKDLGKDINTAYQRCRYRTRQNGGGKNRRPAYPSGAQLAWTTASRMPSCAQQRGKPAKGTVRLNAYHESGSIVIEVSDDGGGLNRERILAKAIEKGIVTPGQNLPEQEIFRLIFEAGFSTAEQVSNISGRGVGMDVVRRNIEALRGTIEIESTYTVGTTIRIRLPLTLAIIDGFLVGVGKSSFVIPLDMVVECIEMSEQDRQALAQRNYVNLRNGVLPFIRLRDLFEISGNEPRRENIVVVKYAGQQAGLVVDALLGEFQTVIKPLGSIFEHLQGISGSTILGSGEVALILDVPTLVQRAAAAEEQQHVTSE